MTAKVELLTPSGGKVILDPTDTAVDRVLTLPAVAGTVFNQGNVVGTVSQSSGVPTGSIIERGSNANGEFVKYADGTMICTGSITPASNDNAGTQGTLAVSFIASPVIVGGVNSIASAGMGASFVTEVTGLGVSGYVAKTLTHGATFIQDAPNFQIRIIAIGRWF